MSGDDFDEYFDEAIVPERKALYAHLWKASVSLKDAIGHLERLKSDAVFDVEYEGVTEFEKFLREADRMATIARALMSTDASGGMDGDQRLAETVRALMSESHLK